MFRGTRELVAISVSCREAIIEIQSIILPFKDRAGKAIAANEKILLAGYLIDRGVRVSEQELIQYFTGPGWKIL
jgi:hypothetical protein